VLSIKRRASVERFNHDLHQASGFNTSPILFVVLLSGVYMNLPDQSMALVQQLSPGTRGFKDSLHSLQAVGTRPQYLQRSRTNLSRMAMAVTQRQGF
jgi:uncharacterized iron-regulated membrane protein